MSTIGVASLAARRSIVFGALLPLIDGVVPAHRAVDDGWLLDSGGRVVLDHILEGDSARLTVRLDLPDAAAPMRLGLRLTGLSGVDRYLRNGYHSWDGSEFVVLTGDAHSTAIVGHAMTALLPMAGGASAGGAVVIGFERHDRFQTCFGFTNEAGSLTIDAETLLDATGVLIGETLVIFDGDEVEPALRRWSRLVAAASPLQPRLPARITGWCSWYNLYAQIDEARILEQLAAAAAFRDAHGVRLDVFQIDDGFTPEMGDWLAVKPQFPRGLAPIVAAIAAAGFTPGLWIAPFMVGNRSRLAQAHPDWLVTDAVTGAPLVQSRYYGEFRWFKRSEEYHILDVTHPAARDYIVQVFRRWSDWGVRYFKIDFLMFGSEHGPDTARWHGVGQSRIAIWRSLLTLIRAAVGEQAIILGCGCPLWASVGLVDAVRIGFDVGVTMQGDYSVDKLLRDQQTRNHAGGVLWQSDPDCILLRDRFHYLTDAQLEGAARFAANTGGVLMTSDSLHELSSARAALFAELLRDDVDGCAFPTLGTASPPIQRVERRSGTTDVPVAIAN